MTTEERGSQLFSEAIRSLEDGESDRAEQLFIGALNNLDKKHHLAILSLKSLVTITSNRGDFDSAIDWSLKLLESQTGALGHTHADVSRTVMNIATMCETLGKHDIAREVKELHQYASQAERAQKAQQVKNIRTTAKQVHEEQPLEEGAYDAQSATIHTYMRKQGEQIQDKIEGASAVLMSVLFMAIVLVFYGAFFGMKLAYTGEHNRDLAQPREGADGVSAPTKFISADNRVEFQFVTPTKVDVTVDDKKVALPFNSYGYSGIEIGDLMLTLPFVKEYWVMLNPDGLTDGRRSFINERAADREVLAQIATVADTASHYYKKNKAYPDNITEIGDFTYFNPYTLRKDYPLIQIVTAPGHSTPEGFLYSLRKGALWPGESTLYPGCINIAHVSHRMNMSVPETIVIHGCNRYGRFFSQSTGDPYYIVFEKGMQLEPRAPKLEFLQDVTRICVLDIDPTWSGLVLWLITARFVLFFGLLFALFYAIAGRFGNDSTKRVAYIFGTVFLVLSLVCIYFAWFF